VVAAPDVEQTHGIDHAGYALLIFSVPTLLAALVEAPLALVSDCVPRRRVLALGLVALSASLLLAALAEHVWLLSLGLGLAGAAGGVVCGAAQAELVASAQHGGAERALSRWTVWASAGDMLVPPVVAAATWLGSSHRAALGSVAILIAAHALALWRAPVRLSDTSSAACEREEEQRLPVWLALRRSARMPRLWALLLATASCALLDELVVAFAALRLHEHGWSPASAGAALTACSVGSLFGAVAAERVLARVAPRRVLAFSAIASLGALLLFVTASSPFVLAPALFLLGAAAAPHYPLAQAQAYAQARGNPGVVNALGQMLVVVDVGLPFVLGAIATRHGTTAALLALALQPLCMLLVARAPEPRRQ
jgi:predicted MFS family arabinose efflux permease